MMFCLPCQPSKPAPHACEYANGAITPCECPACFPSALPTLFDTPRKEGP